MQAEFKRNLIISVILHGMVFGGFFLAMAFAPTPRLDTVTMMELVGGGDGGGEPAVGPTPPPPLPPPPPPAKHEEQQKPPEPAKIEKPKDPDIVVPKPETPKKKVEEKPKEPKKEEVRKPTPPKPVVKQDVRPKVEVSTNRVTRSKVLKESSQPKQFTKLDPKYSAQAVRDRLAKAAQTVKVASVGGGPGPATGATGASGTVFQGYCTMVSQMLYEVWDIPGQVTPNMSTVVQVHITRDGSISFVKLAKSSGSTAMDESAIAAVRSRGKVDPIPESLGTSLDLTVLFKPLGA